MMAAWLALGLSLASAGDRYALVVGQNRGLPGELPLRYADEDARKVAGVLEELGDFDPEDIIVLTRSDAEEMRRALADVSARLRDDQPGRALLFVYYSGHADAEGLHLDGTVFPHDELENLVRGSSAAVRMLVVDACRSGALTRVKGVSLGPPVAPRVQVRTRGEGAVILSSTTMGEDAQESASLGGSFFTHHLVSGLRGGADTDQDGRVVVEEAFRHAYAGTVRSSARTAAGIQHPTFAMEVKGTESVVLTELGDRRRTGSLSFPQERTWLLSSPDGDVVAEVGTDDTARSLAVRPGLYRVMGRGRDHFLEGTLTVRAHETTDVADADLRRLDYARVVRKGWSDHVAHSVGAGWQVRPGLEADGELCQGPTLSGTRVPGVLSVELRAGMCRGGFDNGLVEAISDDWSSEVGLVWARDLTPLTVGIGVSAGTAVLVQSFDTDREALDRTTLAARGGLGLRMERHLARGWVARAAIEARGTAFPQEQDGEVVQARIVVPSVSLGGARVF